MQSQFASQTLFSSEKKLLRRGNLTRSLILLKSKSCSYPDLKSPLQRKKGIPVFQRSETECWEDINKWPLVDLGECKEIYKYN